MLEQLESDAGHITAAQLARTGDAPNSARLVPDRRARFLRMMGLDGALAMEPRTSPPVHITGTLHRTGYRIEKLHYESLPGLHVTANLYLPDAPPGTRVPAVLYQCGHAESQKVHYQAHPRRFAQLGLACLILDTIQLGEDRGDHHGCYARGWFHWYSRGYTPAGAELLNAIRGLDLLAARPEVDAARMGATGCSGGGALTWWLAAADERVASAALVCGTSTLASYIGDRTIDGHCDCMWFVNYERWDLATVAELVVPRPLLIASADRDDLFALDAIRAAAGSAGALYAAADAADRIRLVEFPGEHGYDATARTEVFSWMLKHLAGRDAPPAEVGDADLAPERQEIADTLRVYVSGPPPGNRVATIHDELVPTAGPPEVRDHAGLVAARELTIRALRETAFAHFDPAETPLEAARVHDWEDGGRVGCRFAYTSEHGLRLHGSLAVRPPVPDPSPALVALRSPGEPRGDAERLLDRAGGGSVTAILEPRGTGETAWGEELSWTIRRSAAWTGRTVASLRVWDVLRGIEAMRELPGVERAGITLAASGEMCAVALYAALLDGAVAGLVLEDPPATQNAPSRPDGRGPAIEMLGCLRVTDLPLVAGLLFPAEIHFLTKPPSTYTWAADLYRRLGEPFRFRVPA